MKKPRASRNTFGWSSQTSRSEGFNFSKRVYSYPGALPGGPLRRALPWKLRPAGRKRVQAGVAILVILVVVGEIVSVAHAGHPLSVALVPIDRLSKSFFERNRRLPAEVFLHFVAQQRVSPVVPGAVLHVGEQRLRLADQAQQRACDCQIFFHVQTADVVHLADAPALKNC